MPAKTKRERKKKDQERASDYSWIQGTGARAWTDPPWPPRNRSGSLCNQRSVQEDIKIQDDSGGGKRVRGKNWLGYLQKMIMARLGCDRRSAYTLSSGCMAGRRARCGGSGGRRRRWSVQSQAKLPTQQIPSQSLAQGESKRPICSLHLPQNSNEISWWCCFFAFFHVFLSPARNLDRTT